MAKRGSEDCGCSQGVSLNSLGADGVEFAFLTAARFFFTSFSGQDPSEWVTAILGTENFFPGPYSAEKMRRTLAVVHEMRTSRRSVFSYSNPRCPRCSNMATQDERHLLQMIQYARQGRHSMMVSSAMLLCEGQDTDRLIAAAKGFAELLSHKEELVSPYH